MHEHNRLQEFDNYERRRIRPTTTGMPCDSRRTVALHKKEERHRGTARRRCKSPSLSSYVETDDDGDDGGGDEATFPGGAKFFVKMQSARQWGWYKSRQKTQQHSHTEMDPRRTDQDHLVFGALPSQIQLVSNKIRFFLQNTHGTMPKRMSLSPLYPSPSADLDKKDEAKRCNFPSRTFTFFRD